MKVGILAIQGDYEAHADAVKRAGGEPVLIRTRDELKNADALILPGGESSTQLQFLEEEGLDKAIERFSREKKPIFGTCAGAILLAQRVKNPVQDSLGLAEISVVRNAYGRQLSSEVRSEESKISDAPLEMVFIRAPVIEKTGPGVEILAESAGKPVLVRQKNILIATFHPELSPDSTVHEYFLKMARNGHH
ncbi:MAG TPA: pyridoxal 5'-phosphate synthase glutaminase subunit PdxT [Candidatus Acidoferrales bacterium]|nr:pyridoxal 5'-phosphate synthase glutaminase subunit PdxT [Candidatus Acidoferrales bacterium]